MLPQVTVLMPAYNCAAFIREAIESMLTQTFTDFEFLIIDDGSTDETLAIIKSFHDPRIRVVENGKNRGITHTLNLGLSLARGKYIARMDADDRSDRFRLERQWSVLEANPDIDVLGTWFRLSTGGLVQHPIDDLAIRSVMLCHYCALGHPTVMMRRAALEASGFTYPYKYKHAEDYALWISMAQTSKFQNLPEFLLTYRMHETQVSSQNARLQVRASLRLRHRFLFSLYPIVPSSIRRRIIRQNMRGNLKALERIPIVPYLVFIFMLNIFLRKIKTIELAKYFLHFLCSAIRKEEPIDENSRA